jgi:hypothetical protein
MTAEDRDEQPSPEAPTPSGRLRELGGRLGGNGRAQKDS